MLQHLFFADIQYGGQVGGNEFISWLRIVGVFPFPLFGLGNLFGVCFLQFYDISGRQDDIFHRGRHSQWVSVGVVNAAAVGRHRIITGGVVDGKFLIIIVLGDLNVPQFPEQRNKHRYAENAHQQNGTPKDQAVGTPVVFSFLLFLFGHAVRLLSLCPHSLI